ncbi:unnamed protein product [Miscanthus lutarioriparius]|uniref:Uncharacterized protein n=1 Tax=Miscanthus lutarioriparius TaxID=422564 RepID=A0A811PLX9_9POAL|nr:unnamed protein product [Miscanthus lutarioriparius]
MASMKDKASTVIDESCVGSKPKKKDKYDCLVRLYGTCQYLYVDPWKSNLEFEMMLKQENKSAMEAFRDVLEKELSGVNSCSDYEDGYEEEAVNSKGGDSKGTSKKTSSRKARKQGLKQQYNEEEDQNAGSNATTGSARKRKGGRARQSSSTHDGKDYSDSSAEGLRNKRQKYAAQSASVGRREGLRQSARSDAKQYLDAAEGNTEPLTDILGSEGAARGSKHTEIKAMVRDILFKDIIDKEHDAEMAYVDEVINGICNATDSVIGSGDASTKGGRGLKQSGSGVEGESSNAPLQKAAVLHVEATGISVNGQHPELMDASSWRLVSCPACAATKGGYEYWLLRREGTRGKVTQ